MAKKLPSLSLKLDTSAIAGQFRNLRGRHAGLWPPLPRGLLMLALFASIVAAGYALYWRGLFEELEAGRQQEEQLKVQYADKLKQAVNLDTLRKQKQQVSLYVHQLEKQLPSKAEMDALLSDINQAGVSRGLQFELFKPGQVVVKEYYAELPIDIKITGNYHDVGAFTSDIANLPRIVTLNNLVLSTGKDGNLTLDAVAKTFRYLDRDEVLAQRQSAADKKKAKK